MPSRPVWPESICLISLAALPPIAVEQIRAEKILDFEIALPFEKPVAVRQGSI